MTTSHKHHTGRAWVAGLVLVVTALILGSNCQRAEHHEPATDHALPELSRMHDDKLDVHQTHPGTVHNPPAHDHVAHDPYNHPEGPLPEHSPIGTTPAAHTPASDANQEHTGPQHEQHPMKHNDEGIHPEENAKHKDEPHDEASGRTERPGELPTALPVGQSLVTASSDCRLWTPFLNPQMLGSMAFAFPSLRRRNRTAIFPRRERGQPGCDWLHLGTVLSFGPWFYCKVSRATWSGVR